MRLYLSSYGVGNYGERLVALVGANKKVAIILNAGDHKTDSPHEERLAEEMSALSTLGFDAEELDLRQYFGKPDALRERLALYGLVWIRGGNVFVLERAFHASGFDAVIKDMLAQDSIVYGGYSAATCLATPSLRGGDLVDDPDIVPDGYEKQFRWEALGLIGYEVAVHYKSDHYESAIIEQEVAYYETNNIEYKTLRDGEVIVVDGEKEEILRLN